MAVEEILIKYEVDDSELKTLATGVGKVTASVKEMGVAAKAAFSANTLSEANAGLDKHVTKIQTVEKAYSSAKAELKALTNQITSGALEGEALQKATQHAAELTDKIADVREEIKQLSSDTRVFDLVSEGARGVAAGFSVAAGASALFGEENKDLQKVIAKSQAAMALLQGVQELATIATRQGGIATKAYGLALKGVEAIQKAFGISAAASWAVATAGITLAIAAVAYFVSNMDDATESTKEFDDTLKDQKKAIEELQLAIFTKGGLISEFQANLAKIERERADALDEINKAVEKNAKEKAPGANTLLLQIDPIAEIQRVADAYKEIYGKAKEQAQPTIDAINERFDKQRKLAQIENDNALAEEAKKAAEKAAKDAEDARQKAEAKRRADFNAKLKAIEDETNRILAKEDELRKQHLKSSIPDLKGDISELDIPAILIPVKPEFNTKDFKAQVVSFGQELAKELDKVKEVLQGIQQAVGLVFEGQTEKIESEKENQLAILNDKSQQELALAGNDAKQKEIILRETEAKKAQIERTAAIKKAMLERQKAIFNKTFALANAIINTASAVASKLDSPVEAILAGALGAIEIALIASQPIPEIPKFEKGGPVPLMGGEIRRDGAIVGRSHRDGGVLIEASGGEFINNPKSTAKYYDELKAANDMNLEGLIYSKYLEPALREVTARKEQEAYDDYLVRSELRRLGERGSRDAKAIIKGVVNGVSENAYYNKRYYS